MEWWLWVIMGFFLLIAELMTPGGFYMLFFGLGAILVGALDALGWAGPAWSQWLLFSVLSVVTLLVFRRPLMRRFKPLKSDKVVDSLPGETALAMEEIAVDAIGKAELRGASWSVRNLGPNPLRRGDRCIVERVEGLVLWVHSP